MPYPDVFTVWALRALSLTCKGMVPMCQRHLFATIRFSTDRTDSPRPRRTSSDFLLSKPLIMTHYVKCLSLGAWHPVSTSDFDCLHRICELSSLNFFELVSKHALSWIDVPERTKAIILSIIQIPTLRHLILDHIDCFPAVVLSLCPGLDEINFRNICYLTPPDAREVTQGPSVTTLMLRYNYYDGNHRYIRVNNTLDVTMNPILGQSTGKAAGPLIIYDRLKNITIRINTHEEFSQTCQLLEKATDLERLDIDGEFYFHV